jgi:hypothetical protein
LWMASRVNGSLSLSFSANCGTFTYLGLHQLHTREMGGRTDIGMGQAGPVRSPLRTRGSSWHFALCPSNCIILTMSSSRPRWRVFLHEVQSFTLQSSGIFLCNTSVLATFWSDFIMLSNTNENPQLLLWTCCDSVLYVHVFLQKHNTSKCFHTQRWTCYIKSVPSGGLVS